MSNEYAELLEATIKHLQTEQNKGREFIAVDGEILRALQQPIARTPRITSQATEQAPGESSVGKASEIRANATPFVSAPARFSEPQDKEAAMADVRCRALQCQKCPNLANSRRNVVFGVGTIHTELMFVGEAPGADEDQKGEPFVGAAGQLLTKIIQTMGYSRDSVYIANVLKCRPDTPGQMYGNRKPTPEEMKTCLPFLLAQIDIIQPKVIVALGATAVEGLFGKSLGIMKLRGNWQVFRDIPVMPTYHPAYLLRNQAMTEKRKVWEDMLQVLEKLGRSVTEKQRGYFLK